MSIKEKINDVAVYFRNKLITGDYEFISCGDYKATVKVEDYTFDLWIANDIKVNLGIYPSENILSNKVLFRGEEDRLKVWDSLEPYVKAFRKKKRLEELNELKDRIERLEE